MILTRKNENINVPMGAMVTATTLGETTQLSVSYNDVMSMVNSGVIPFIFEDSFIIMLTAVGYGEGNYTAVFGENIYKNADPDGPLTMGGIG